MTLCMLDLAQVGFALASPGDYNPFFNEDRIPPEAFRIPTQTLKSLCLQNLPTLPRGLYVKKCVLKSTIQATIVRLVARGIGRPLADNFDPTQLLKLDRL